MKKAGHTLKTNMFFDTIKFTPRNGQNEIIHRANKHKINLRYYLDGSVRTLSPFRLHVSCMYLQILCANNLSPLRLNAICIFYVYVPANSYDFVSVGWNFSGWNSWKRRPEGTSAHCRLLLKHSMRDFFNLFLSLNISNSFNWQIFHFVYIIHSI